MGKIENLPKWAREYIEELRQRIERAEATIPWTKPGMEWFTLLKDAEDETLFLCDKNGTRAIATIGSGDVVFVGRARKGGLEDENAAL